jgi:hypothetical protein
MIGERGQLQAPILPFHLILFAVAPLVIVANTGISGLAVYVGILIVAYGVKTAVPQPRKRVEGDP